MICKYDFASLHNKKNEYFYSQPSVLLKKESVKLLFLGIPKDTEVFWKVEAKNPVLVSAGE